MITLLASTVFTSAADSLNPIAITQQFVLQGMVKKPHHIWYFILPTGITNLIGGFLAYFGLVTFIGGFFEEIIQKYKVIVFTLELILGIAFLIGVCYLVLSAKIKKLKNQIKYLNSNESENKNDIKEVTNKIKSVSPSALVALGVGATISELATALPYFAFLAILFNYNLSLIQVTFILVLYNFIYTLPLMILYFIYIKAQDKFDKFYVFIKAKLTKWSNILAPVLVGIIGIVLVFHSVSVLIK